MLFSLCCLPTEKRCILSSVPELQILRVICGRIYFSQEKKKKTTQSNMKQKQQNKRKQKNQQNQHRDKRATLVVIRRKASNISCKKVVCFQIHM